MIVLQETIAEYIRSKGWESKIQAGQIVVKECPFCHDVKGHFYADPDKGVWFCHKCQEKGNLWSLKQRMGDIQQQTIQPAFRKPKPKQLDQSWDNKFHRTLLNSPEILEYLQNRGINNKSIAQFRLGFYRKNGTDWLSIPHFRGEKLINIKSRSLPPAEKTFKRIQGCESVLFNEDCLEKQKEIFITEGELDAITLIQAGIHNVVSGTTGAGSFDPAWIDQLKDIAKAYLCYDPDEVGQKGARLLAKRLGYERCFNVELPEGQDVNDFFKDHDLQEFQVLVHQARKFDLPGIISLNTAIGLLKSQMLGGENQGLPTPWPNVNRITKGFHPGDLIIVSAFPKVGKTSWALNVVTELAFKNYPVLFFCLEMRPERLTRKLVSYQYWVSYDDVTSHDVERAENELAGLPLYFGYTFQKHKLDDVLSLIREAIKRYDLKLVVFDNLHWQIRSISNVNEELGQAVQGFKLLAEEMEIPIIAIAQPRKREVGRPNQIMQADDIKYSNAIHADCDQMIILHRKRIASKAKEIEQEGFRGKEQALDPITLVRVEAHRYGSGGETLLYFHGELSKFNEVHGEEENENDG